MGARNARLARRAPAGGAIGRQAPSETRGGRAILAAPLRHPFATRNSSLAPPRALQRPGSSAVYENATNVNRNAADTIHMSGLTSRQWPCVTFTTT